MKNIIAFILSLLAGFLALFQGGCAFVGGGAFAQYDREMAKIGAAGFLVVIAAIVGFVGGSMALAKKRKAFYLSYISAGIMLISALFLKFTDGAIYSIIYMIAAMLTDYKFAFFKASSPSFNASCKVKTGTSTSGKKLSSSLLSKTILSLL